MQLENWDMAVAIAAPFRPMPIGNINSQSRNTFSTAPSTMHSIEYAGLPSALMSGADAWVNRWNGRPNIVTDRYVIASGYTVPAGSAPQSATISLLNTKSSRPVMMPAAAAPVMPVRTYFFASSILPAP